MPAKRTVALLVLGLLCFQLSRVYVVVPADAFLCNFPAHSHDGSAAAGHHHDYDEGEALEASLTQNDDGGTYIQHCKDTLDGLGLTSAQPFSLTAAAVTPGPEPSAIILPAETLPALDSHLHPPFQPPRNLS